MTNDEVKKLSARRTRRAFLVGAVGAAAGYEFYRYIDKTPGDETLQAPLRKALNVNEAVARGVFSERGLAPTYPVGKSVELRINGNFGLKQDLVPASYRLQVVGVEGAAKMPQYVKDVTAWDYQYVAEQAAYTGHDTKEAPKAAPAMPPEFQKAMEAYNASNKGKPPRGQEEAGKSDSTLDPNTPGLLLTMDDVTKLPRQELVTQFKCIEGWS